MKTNAMKILKQVVAKSEDLSSRLFYRIGYKCPIFSGLLDNFVTFIETGVIAINHTTVVYYDHLNAPISPSITGLWNSLNRKKSTKSAKQFSN